MERTLYLTFVEVCMYITTWLYECRRLTGTTRGTARRPVQHPSSSTASTWSLKDFSGRVIPLNWHANGFEKSAVGEADTTKLALTDGKGNSLTLFLHVVLYMFLVPM